MKVYIELDVPENTTAQEVQTVLREFRWLVRLRGWRTLLALPSFKPKRQQA